MKHCVMGEIYEPWFYQGNLMKHYCTNNLPGKKHETLFHQGKFLKYIILTCEVHEILFYQGKFLTEPPNIDLLELEVDQNNVKLNEVSSFINLGILQSAFLQNKGKVD